LRIACGGARLGVVVIGHIPLLGVMEALWKPFTTQASGSFPLVDAFADPLRRELTKQANLNPVRAIPLRPSQHPPPVW
jgi:hypothetical protein